MVTEKGAIRMSLVDFQLDFGIPFFTVLGMFILFVVFLFLNGCLVCGGTLESVPVLYDHSNCLNYHYQYVVRLLYAGVSSSYRPDRTTVSVLIDHSRDRLVRLSFRPWCMQNIFVYKGLHCAKVFLRSAERYRDLRGVMLHHDGTGLLIVHSVEIQDTQQPNALIALVKHPIGDEESMHKVPPFSFGNEKPTPIEPDIRPSTNLTCMEMAIFFYAALHFMFAIIALMMIHYCQKDMCKMEKVFMLGSMAAIAGLAAFLITIIPFRCCVKLINYWSMGRGCGTVVWFMYLMILAIGGLFAAFVTCEMASRPIFLQLNQGAQVFTPGTFWLAAAVVAIFLFLIMVVMLVPLAICFRFIRVGDEFDWRQQLIQNPFGSRTMGGFTFRRNRREQTFDMLENYRSDEVLEAAKSIHAAEYYDGTDTEPVQPGAFFDAYNAPVRQPVTVNRTRRQRRKRRHSERADSSSRRLIRPGLSPDEDEQTYCGVLAKRKKSIRSISTFQRQKQQRRGQSPMVGGGGQRTPSRPRTPVSPTSQPTDIDSESYTTIIAAKMDGSPPRIRKGISPRRPMSPSLPQRNKSSEPNAEAETYYATMMKMAKIRSVSQYHNRKKKKSKPTRPSPIA